MSCETEDPNVAYLGKWKKQLVTKEDPLHVHKTLGILCLFSFIWRYAHFGSSDMGFLSHPHLTIPTVCLHFMLTASSFQFKIPARRIKDGTRIWPEYRMHSMVFLCRSLAAITVYWYEDHYGLDRNYDLSLLIVLATMAAADLCSASVGKEYQSNSVRDVSMPPAVKFLFSIAQFGATSNYIMGTRLYSVPLMHCMIVQMTPFLGTLRRKHLIGAYFGLFLYALFLASTGVLLNRYIPAIEMRVVLCFGFAAAFWRTAPFPDFLKPLQNKYIIWTSIGLLMRHFRPMFTTVWTVNQVTVALCAELLVVFAMGYLKISGGYYSSRKDAAQKTVTMGENGSAGTAKKVA